MARETDWGGAPYLIAAGGLKVLLRLQPGAARNALEGVMPLADGRQAIRARVTAAPEAGKANAAAVKLLAKAWGLPKSAITIIAGQTDRTKTLLLAGDGDELRARLEAWLNLRGEQLSQEPGSTGAEARNRTRKG